MPSKTNFATMRSNGCLVTSVAMILADCGKKIDNAIVTPKSLNTWLIKNKGYEGKSFLWESLRKFGLKLVAKNSNPNQIAAHFELGKHVILNVNKGGHWVLVTGVSVNSKGKIVYSVNDPGYKDITSYTES